VRFLIWTALALAVTVGLLYLGRYAIRREYHHPHRRNRHQ